MEFENLQSTLARNAAPAGAAESHGTLCGVVCSGAEADAAWLAHLMGEPGADAAARRECDELLRALREHARRQLAGFDMEFVPLLPGDSTPLTERVEALGLWCQGFLFGLSLGRSRAALDQLAGEAGEVLHDVTEIARAGFDAGESDEADEQAYSELVEYLRVAVQILYEELNAAAVSEPEHPGTLH
ncbi:MAG TPA: UPF0149 family protein [Gammaproteobacteria bacterium]|nr:UPF0149 family protein [Gammaproteobacteria bacterium]